MKKTKQPVIMVGHYLSGARFDVWIRLLAANIGHIKPASIPQAVFLTLLTLVMFPFALIEKAVFHLPIRRTKIEKPPIQIIGIWRTGTTNMQYTLAQDPGLGWLDPVNSVTISNSILMGRVIKHILKHVLKDARPMDNMEYTVDLPMEDLYALSTISTEAFNHMIGFPGNAKRYIDTLYTRELPEDMQRRWRKNYDYILRKLTYVKKGKRLMLKSPDNSCHIAEFSDLYPGTKYILMCRNPYKVIPSIMKTFKDMTALMTFEKMPEDEDIEYYTFEIFEKLNKIMIDDIRSIPEGDIVTVHHEDFAREPMKVLEDVYRNLGLEGFEEARPYFEKYRESQKDYRPNRLELEPGLKKKINERCAFYFDYFGYEMEE
ncbi:MAG: sulfotransferase [Anaerovoracaceae bacterium]|nr:sulfotransferase [Anaerovoracaceae bacterium]